MPLDGGGSQTCEQEEQIRGRTTTRGAWPSLRSRSSFLVSLRVVVAPQEGHGIIASAIRLSPPGFASFPPEYGGGPVPSQGQTTTSAGRSGRSLDRIVFAACGVAEQKHAS